MFLLEKNCNFGAPVTQPAYVRMPYICHLQSHATVLYSISNLSLSVFWGNQAQHLYHPLSLRGLLLGCNPNSIFTVRKWRRATTVLLHNVFCFTLYIWLSDPLKIMWEYFQSPDGNWLVIYCSYLPAFE